MHKQQTVLDTTSHGRTRLGSGLDQARTRTWTRSLTIIRTLEAKKYWVILQDFCCLIDEYLTFIITHFIKLVLLQTCKITVCVTSRLLFFNFLGENWLLDLILTCDQSSIHHYIQRVERAPSLIAIYFLAHSLPLALLTRLPMRRS